MKRFKSIGLIFLVLMVINFQLLLPAFASDQSVSQNIVPKQGYAYSTINVTLTDTSMSYLRGTVLNQPAGWEESISLFTFSASLTTHGDIFVDIYVEYPQNTFPNLQVFQNSTKDYDTNYYFLGKIVKVPISLLDVSSNAFLAQNQTIYNPATGNRDSKWVISQQFIIRETTAFIYALNEPFKFDSNFIELGALQDLNFKVIYQHLSTNQFYREDLKIISLGSPLEYIGSTKGYEGNIYFTDHQPQPLDVYPRQTVNQTIVYKFELPENQEIGLTTDYDYNSIEGSTFSEKSSITGSSFSLAFNTGDLMPYFVTVTSFTPLLKQFSLTDYASWALGILTGLFAVLRGLPFYLRRRSTAGYRKHLKSLAQEKNFDSLSKELDSAYQKFINEKMSLQQYKDISSEYEILIKNINRD